MLLQLILSACLLCFISAHDASSIGYKTYAEMVKYLLELNASFPDVVQVSVAQETYNLPYPDELQCLVDDETKATEPCKQFVVHVTNHSTLSSDPERPEVFISGALHGDERVGPMAAIELVALVAHATSKYETDVEKKPTVDTQRWLQALVNTRNVLVMPMTNAYGYSHNKREELTLDPNRDYNYMRSGAECMQTMTSRVVNEIWREHIFQLAVTFHGGTRAVAYEWGSPDHYLHGNDKKPSEKSPDHVAQFQMSNTLANFAGAFPDGELYPTGTMNDVVYGVSGGMEDWGYAASWENQFYDDKSQPFRPCEPTTFGGYPKEKTIYNNITNRAFNMLVETSKIKAPKAAELGDYNELYKANVDFFRTEGGMTKYVGHVPRNVRLALMMIEMVQPLVRWVDAARSFKSRSDKDFAAASLYTTDIDQVIEMGCGILAWKRSQVATCTTGECSMKNGSHFKLQLAWEVLGALTVDSTYVQVSSSSSFEDDSILMESTIQKGTTRRFYEFAPNSSQAIAANTDTMGTSLFVTCLDMGNVTSDKIYVRALATVDQDWRKQGSGDDGPSPRVPPQSHLVNSRTNLDWSFEWNGHKVKSALEWASPILTVDTAKRLKKKKSLTGKEHVKDAPDDSSDEDTTTTSSNAVTATPGSVKTSDNGDDDDSDDNESKDSEASRKHGGNTLTDDKSKDSIDDRNATLKPSSSDTTQGLIALTSTNVEKKKSPSSLLQFGYLIMSSCAMIILLTFVYLYRRVFRGARQSYINISNLEQATRSRISDDDNEVSNVDNNESDEGGGGPQSSR